MRVIIVGSEGFIGTHLTRELQDAGHPVAGLDIKKAGDARVPRVVQGAIEDHRADVLVHLAGRASDNVMEATRDSVGMTAVVAGVCAEFGARLVYLSSDGIYGENGLRVCDEVEGPFSLPQSLSAMNKLFGEKIGELLAPDGFTTLRLSDVYGPGQSAGDEMTDLLQQATQGKPIAVSDGAERSLLYIGDAVRAIRLAIERGEGPFNIGPDGDRPTMEGIAEIACGLTGSDIGSIEKRKTAPTTATRLSTQRIRRLGWEPGITLYEGMKHTLELGWPEPAVELESVA